MNDGDDDKKAPDTATSETGEVSAKGAKGGREGSPPRTTVLQWVLLVVVAGGTAALDLWSKRWAIRNLAIHVLHPGPVCESDHYTYQNNPKPALQVVGDYLQFHYAENCGGAWGLLHGAPEKLRRPFFMLVTIGAVAFILYLYRTLEEGQRAMRVALPLVLGGALGNLVDRMTLGYVVDFIDMHLRERYHWPTYNVADIAITVGIGLMLLEYVLGPRRVPTKAKVKTAAS